MATRGEFEAAADLFDDAGYQVRLLGDLDGIVPEGIVRGGRLGEAVPRRLAQAKSTAEHAQRLVADAAATCRARAQIIAAYEAQLHAFDVAFGQFVAASIHWGAQYEAWNLDESGVVSHPGPQPIAPPPPDPPPDWAEVRRL